MSPILRPSLALLLLAAGCSSAESKPVVKPLEPGSGGNISADETWKDGKQITSAINVAAGVTVTIAPGATVTVAKGVTIALQGTLKAASAATHAKLTGETWGGIVVQGGGSLALDGVDITGATMALTVQYTEATYDNGTITGNGAFAITKGAKLTTSHATVIGAKVPSTVSGAFVATYLDYEGTGLEGIMANDVGATISIEDSKLHGNSAPDNDLIVANGAASVHVAYTDLSKAHCGMHFNRVIAFDVSFVSVHDSTNGFRLYGSETSGTRTITSANIFNNHGTGVDEGSPTTENGAISISDGYWSNNGGSAEDNIRQFTTAIKVANMSTTEKIPGVGPR